MGAVKRAGQKTKGSAMIEYFEVVGILFCETLIFYSTFHAIYKLLTLIWEKIK